MTTNLMIDFETLGLGDKAVLLALGACTFDPATGEIGAEFYSAIDPRTQPGRDISPDTVIWWMQQDEAARTKITDAVKLADTLEGGIPEDMPEAEVDDLYKNAAHSIQSVARAFISWFDTLGDDVQVWANGAVDHNWMQSMMEYCGYKNPVKFWNQRDYRTLKGLFPHITAEFSGVKHNALDDAIHQAKHTVKLLQAVADAPLPYPLMGSGEARERFARMTRLMPGEKAEMCYCEDCLTALNRGTLSDTEQCPTCGKFLTNISRVGAPLRLVDNKEDAQ